GRSRRGCHAWPPWLASPCAWSRGWRGAQDAADAILMELIAKDIIRKTRGDVLSFCGQDHHGQGRKYGQGRKW
ncbi:MAG TPA: hypothetical protein VMI52_11315, partial [Acetobacteraceae bacterium]|nr:hypothetical protein [Acetobacteraceae bacterium]